MSPLAPFFSDPAAQSVPYSQDFSALLHTSTTYPAGWQGWELSTSGATISFRTTTWTADLALNASSGASTTGGGVHNYNGKIGFLQTGGSDPSIALAINTTGNSGIKVSYDIMTIRNPHNGTTNTRVNEVTLQYRVGIVGAFTTLTGIEYQNNTTSQTGSGVTTPQNLQSKTITLPAACDNQSIVELRWVARDVTGSGSRPSFAVDNISVAPPPDISIADKSQAEGNSGTTTMSFTVTRSGELSGTSTVNYSTTAGTATQGASGSCGTAGVDYESASGLLTFVPSDATETITVTVCGDATAEPDETFTVNLATPSNATISDASGAGTITNDDGSVTYTWSPNSVTALATCALNPLTTNAWICPGNWTPLRPTAASLSTSDILIFDGFVTSGPTVFKVPTQAIAAFQAKNGINEAKFEADGPVTLTINGNTGSDFSIQAGSAVRLQGTNAITISLTAADQEGIIAGNLVFEGAAHKLTGANPGEIVFQSGSIFATTTNFTGHPFGSGMAGSVVFAGGSNSFYNAGSDPFGGAGKEIVVFSISPLSNQEFSAATAFSTDGRTYGNLSLSGTTAFTGSGSGDLTVMGNFQMGTATTLTLSSTSGADMVVNGNWTDSNNSATAFTANGRTVTFSGASLTQNISKSGVETFDDLAIAKTGGSVVSATVAVEGALQFNGATDVLEFTSSLQLNGTVGGTNAAGALKCQTLGCNLLIGGTGALGTIRFVSGGDSINSLTVNRTASGSVNIGTNVNIGSQFLGGVNLTNGIVDMGSNTMSLAEFPSMNATNGYVIGNVKKTFGATAAFTFAVGTLNGYSPMGINVTGNSFPSSLTVKAVQGPQPNITGTNALQRYWTLTETGDLLADLTFNYLDPTDIPGTADENAFIIFKYDGSFSTPGGTVTPATNTATISGVSDFSDWTLAEAAAVEEGTLGFSASNYDDSETNTDHSATITVSRTLGTDGAVSVQWATSANSATAGTDYVEASGTLNWADGEGGDKTFTVTVKGDTDVEPNELVDLTLSLPTGGATIGGTNPATLTIQDDDVNNASVGDRVWSDTNGDGVQDGGEAGLNGVTVELLDNGSNVIGTTTTSGDGNYSFGSLAAGTYSVRIASSSVPAGYTQTYDLDGTGTAHIATFTLTAGQTRTDVDFGYKPPAAADTDVTFSAGTLTITDVGSATDDTLRIFRNGATLRVEDPSHTLSCGTGTTTVSANTCQVDDFNAIGNIQVDTLGGNDLLTVDLSGGDPVPTGGVSYNGGTETGSPGDKLAISGGGNQGTVNYYYTNGTPGAGSVDMSVYGTVNYTGLEPITNSGTATDIIFNLPAGGTSATLADDGAGSNGMSRLSSTPATFEVTDFANPTGSVTINRGDPADTMTVNDLPDFDASLVIGNSTNRFAEIDLAGAITVAGSISVAAAEVTGSGNITTAAGLTVYSVSVFSELSGVISGTGGFTADGFGILTLSGLNTYTGVTTITGGAILSATTLANGSVPSSIGASTSAASNLVLSNGVLEYIGAGASTDRLFTVQTEGEIDNNGGGGLNFTNAASIDAGSSAATLVLCGGYPGTNTFSPIIPNPSSGVLSLEMESLGTYNLEADNTYTGPTEIESGQLNVNGSTAAASAVTVESGATLGGTGTVGGSVTVTGGTVAPGTSPSILNTGNVSFDSNSSFDVEINGPTVGTGYDQLNVTGSVTLGNATLNVTGTYTPAAADSFIIIQNDGTGDAVSGTFNGLPEGASVNVNGFPKVITYTGGDGNDVELQGGTCPASFTVNDNGDAPDTSTGDGVCDSDSGTSGDQCTLRAAIEEADALTGCGTINVNFSLSTPNTISLATALPAIDHNVNINGLGANLLTVQRSTAGGTANFRVFTINSGRTVAISGLTISNGALIGSTFPDSYGGGIFSQGTLTILNSIITGNTAGPSGGGIYHEGPLDLTNSTVSNNTSDSHGGGVLSQGSGGAPVLNVTNSTFSGNQTLTGGGGGLFSNGVTSNLTNCTLSGNSAAIGGGGVFNNDGTVNITNCTIASNTSTSGGGGIRSDPPTTNLRNTIVANNGALDLSGTTVTSQGYNLIENPGGTTIGGNTTGNIIGQDPNLGPLQNNGGPTQTHALLPGSPAIDTGTDCVLTANGCGDGNSAITTDQRGKPRQTDGDSNGTATVDIGSFELEACTTPPTGMANWWPGDGNANDIGGSNNGSLQGGATANGAGKVGQGFSFPGNSGDVVAAPFGPGAFPSSAAGFTLDAWVNFDSLDPIADGIVSAVNSNESGGNAIRSRLMAYESSPGRGGITCGVKNPGNYEIDFGVPDVVFTNTWHHVACTVAPNAPVRIYVDGVLVGTDSNSVGAALPTDVNNVYIGSGEQTTLWNADGRIDEIEIFNRALLATEIAALADAGNAGKCHTSTVTLTVSNSPVLEDGGTNLDYTFTRDGDISGALTVNFSIGGSASFSGDYTQSGAATFDVPSGSGQGTVSFAAGSSTATVTIDPTADTTDEPDEDVVLTITSGSGYTIGSPNTATGTITNDDATLTLVKTVITDNGGTAAATDWTLTATGPTTISGTSGSASVTNAPVSAGAYTLSESGGPSGYTASSWVCTGGMQSGNTITLASGETASCTITNDDIQPKLHVIKHVINDSGGSKTAPDFTINVTGTNASPSSFAGAESPGTLVGLDAGSYSVDEGTDSGYTKSIGANCSGTLVVGDEKTCTITNDDKPGTLVVIKHVINDNGGTKTAADFSMTVTGTNVAPSATFPGAESPGTTVTLDAGSYSVDEAPVAGYAKTLGADCSGSIANGETKTCTITNDDIQPKLHVIKHVINDSGGSKTAPDFTISVTGTNASPNSFAGAESPGTLVGLDAGSYSVDESAVIGYAKTLGANCSGTLAVGDEKTCTITNDDILPAISINDVTAVEGNAGTTDFDFTVSLNYSSTLTVTVNAQTTDDSATTADADYTAAGSPPPLTFAPGTTTQHFHVLVNGDTPYELNDRFFVNLSSPTNATILDGQGDGTITNDDAAPTITINDRTLNEGNSPAGTSNPYTFTVTKAGNATKVVATVNWATANGTSNPATGGATCAGSDYLTNSGTLTFPATGPGSTTQTLVVNVCRDSAFEPNETFFVNLSGEVDATLNDNQGLGTIVNDDSPGSAITVNTTDDVADVQGCDATHCSLREAINAVNTSPNPVTINFGIPATDPRHFYYADDNTGSPGTPNGTVTLANVAVTAATDDTTIVGIDPDWAHSWWSILPTSALPTISPQTVVLNGYSQCPDPNQCAQVNTASVGTNAVLMIEVSGTSAGASTGLAVGGGASTVRGLVINRFAVDGMSLSSSGKTIAGNFIGTDVSGTLDLGNASHGINSSANFSTIGGPLVDRVNLISGNDVDGIRLSNSNSNSLLGNLIGTKANGTASLGNGGNGITLELSGSTFNSIGGPATGEGNTIAFNGADGVNLLTAGGGNAIRGNSIYSNGSTNLHLGIDLAADGVTPNDPMDPDSVGSNKLQNFPIVRTALVGTPNMMRGTLNSEPNQSFTIDLYANDASTGCDPSGKGEGKKYLGSTTADTGANGDALWSFSPAAGTMIVGDFITATATDLLGNTSEFSTCFQATGFNSGTVQFVGAPYTDGETNADHTVTITVSRTGGSNGAVDVTYATSNGSATLADNDYLAASGTLHWNNAETGNKTFTITVKGDAVFEGDETVNITLSGPTNGATITGANPTTLTITNDDPQPTLSINDVSLAEGNAGTTNFVFTVTKTNVGPAAVNFQTQNGTATLVNNDYQTNSGTLTFGTFETTKTIPVLVNGDTTPELDETFSVVLSGETGATLADGTGVGTIRNDEESVSAGQVIISEFRFSGPGANPTAQANNEFIELYNNTDQPLFVATTDSSAGWAVATPSGVPIFFVPNGTLIPARGHFLGTNTSGYSLKDYGGTNAALGDASWTTDVPDNSALAVFRTNNPANFSVPGNRLDSVGPNTEPLGSLYKEGTGYAPLAPADLAQNLEHTFFRQICVFQADCPTPGRPRDTQDNAADFIFADTIGIPTSAGQRLGSPGPENLLSPIKRDSPVGFPGVNLVLLDASVADASAPNRDRNPTSDSANASQYGTMTIRRRVVNQTGGTITRLRFRVIDMTTYPSGAAADLRLRSSSSQSIGSINDPDTCAATGTPTTPTCTVNVNGLTLEQPPNVAAASGGGLNTTITLPGGLAAGQSINVNFLLGVQKTGNFRFYLVIEAVP